MRNVRPLRLAPEWDDRFTRMLVVSAAAHVVAVVALVRVAEQSGPRSLPLVAYTVEITDPSALGGRLPPGAPGPDLSGGPSVPEPKVEPAPPPAPAPAAVEAKPEPPPEPEVVAKVEEPAVPIPEKPTPPPPTPEAKAPEPKPEPKPEAKKPEVKKPEPPPAPAKKPEAAAKPPERKPEAKPPDPKPAAKPGASPGAKPSETAGRPRDGETAPPRDAYSAAAERWRARAGGGLGGTDEGSGPIGAGGEGKGGGGQLVGIEFLAYRQQVINTIKARWTNVIGRPGLVASVFFEIAPDGQVSDIRIHQSSGSAAYDSSALRAVQHANPLPPPPTRYANQFREFVIEFHSEESGGGQGAG